MNQNKSDHDFIGYFGLKNITESSIVAYYIFSNLSDKGHDNYIISPKCGFLHAQEVILIEVRKYVNDQNELDALLDIEDLIFVKALPLNEERFNPGNIDSYDIDETFHKFNIEIMFTLEAMTTDFVEDPVNPPDLTEYMAVEPLEEVKNTLGQGRKRHSFMKELSDEEEQKTEHSELLKMSAHDELFEEKVNKIEYVEKQGPPVGHQNHHSEEQSEQAQNVYENSDSDSSDHNKDEHYDDTPFVAAEPMPDQQVGKIDGDMGPDEESQDLSRVGKTDRSQLAKSIRGKCIA
jgi:hypothetical protein